MTDMTLTANLDIHDSEIIQIEKGPLAWARTKQFSRMELEDFRRTMVEKFQDIGFGVNVKCYDTDVPDVYAFDIEINRRLRGNFDPDQQVHEVVNNLAEIPEDEGKGWIKADEGMRAAEQAAKEHKH
jgi:hypothetical protein